MAAHGICAARSACSSADVLARHFRTPVLILRGRRRLAFAMGDPRKSQPLVTKVYVRIPARALLEAIPIAEIELVDQEQLALDLA